MPPRRFKKKSVRKIVERRVAKAIEKYEKTRADSNNTGGSGSTNTGGTVVPEIQGCSYKTFMNCKPHSFKGTEGVVGLKRWFEKIEQVFEICKCVKLTSEVCYVHGSRGRALPGPRGPDWNGNVQTLGLANANQDPLETEPVRAYACSPSWEERFMLEIYQSESSATYTSWIRVLKGHYKDKCPKARNQQNDGARARAYVVVENPQQNPNVVTGERLEKDLRSLACIKADEKKLDDIRVVRDFPEVFLDDLLGLALVREIEFCIDLIPGASPVVRSPYRLAPSKMLELSNQLKEL
ncbi:hypothetical protein Tco_0848924 [Tanacetum coccineum]